MWDEQAIYMVIAAVSNVFMASGGRVYILLVMGFQTDCHLMVIWLQTVMHFSLVFVVSSYPTFSGVITNRQNAYNKTIFFIVPGFPSFIWEEYIYHQSPPNSPVFVQLCSVSLSFLLFPGTPITISILPV